MSIIPIIGLLTDFGLDFAVASMKALLINELKNTEIVDIDHSIAKFNILSGSFVLEKSYRYFPKGSLFIAIIDPGVGSKREALCVVSQRYVFFAPNNGLLSGILQYDQNACIYSIDESIIIPASYTFHGRDLFVPAAIAYAQGQRNFLSPLSREKVIELNKDSHYIAYIDSFGNIKTTCPVTSKWKKSITISLHQRQYTIPFVTTFSDVDPGTLVGYEGSNNTIEIAANLGSAQQFLDAKVGDSIYIV